MAGASGPTMNIGKKKRNRTIWDDPDAAEVIEIPLEQLHANPFNPRLVYKDDFLDELGDSITAEDGLLQDLSVAEVQGFLDYWRERLAEVQPERLQDLEDELGDVPAEDYVILIGHNRRKALERIGRKSATCKITNSKIPRARLLGLPENLQRAQLNPIEEARGFREALDDGLTQTEVASQTGCKQPHISRRVKLLKLPKEIQQAVMEGLAISEAEILADKPAIADAAWKLMQEQNLNATMAVARVLNPPKPRQAASPATKSAKKKPAGPLPGQQTQSPDTGKSSETSEDEPAGESSSETSEAGSAGDRSGGEGEKQNEQSEQTPEPSAAEVASANRVQACRDLIAAGVPANPRDTLRLLAPALLTVPSKSARDQAHGWLREAPEPIGPTVYRTDTYLSSVRAEGDAKLTARVALAVALAVAEERASMPNRDWDAQDREYIRHLTSIAKYQPTSWEQERLNG